MQDSIYNSNKNNNIKNNKIFINKFTKNISRIMLGEKNQKPLKKV